MAQLGKRNNEAVKQDYEDIPVKKQKVEKKVQENQAIPSAARVWESCVINCSIDEVWKVIRPCHFKFLSDIKKSEIINAKDDSSVGGERVLTYQDETQQTIQIQELSDLHHFCTYNLVVSEPSVSYTSAVHQIRLREVTNPVKDINAQTFIEWTTDFSNDATLEVIEDSRHKKKDAFCDLQSFLKC